MKNIALLFPGQGSQYVGMGQELITEQKYFDQAELASLNFSLTELMAAGPEEKLKQTMFTQPAIVFHSVLLFRKLAEFLQGKDVKITKVLGHSVGEYSALVAAGSLTLKDALKTVNLRGEYMQAAVPMGKGAMYAIVRVPQDIVQKACAESSQDNNEVMCANFNDPTQVVISGHKEACERAVNWLKDNYEGKQMAIPLKVSAPFHSSLMLPAQENLKAHLDTITFNENAIDYIANIDAKNYQAGTDGNTIKENLINQVSGSVLWSQSFNEFPEDTIFIEVGPGKVLTGLNKKINKAFQTITLDTEDSFQKLEELL